MLDIDELTQRTELDSLHWFVRSWWPAVEPTPLDDAPHVRGVCAHLEAVVRGDLKRLVIAVPPRTGKSLIVSVLFPVWVWLRAPTTKFLCASYSDRLALHHSVLCRDLVRHQAFKARWGWRVSAKQDQNEKSRFDTLQGGYRIATSVGASVTGFGGDYLVLDDPLNLSDTDSLTKIRSTRDWYTRAFASRANDPSEARFIQVCQRSHAEDLAALWIELGASACVLPAVYDDTLSRTAPESGWRDDRSAGDLLCPARLDAGFIEQAKREMGREFETQYQQNPVPEEGGLFSRSDFNVIDTEPSDVVQRVRGWDCAASEGTGDYTAGVLVGKRSSGAFVVLDARRGQWGPAEVERQMHAAAKQDGTHTIIAIEQEAGASGKQLLNAFTRQLAGYDVRAASTTGGKEGRARPFSAQVGAGNVQVVGARGWTSAWLDEMTGFPYVAHDDMVDATSHAFNVLAGEQRPVTYQSEHGVIW